MIARRKFLLGTAGLALAGCRSSGRPRLNVYNWSDYVAPDTIENFEKEFGVEVRYAAYESNEEMLAKVFTGNSGWDVVFPTHSRLLPMSASGLLAPLRHDWLPGLKNLAPLFQKPAWDAELRLGVPYMWTSTGIVYSRKLERPLTQWADLWDPRLSGRMTMLDDPEDLLGACLKKLHLPFSSGDEAELSRARQEALAQKPLLRAYLNAEVRDQLVAGDVLAAQLWSTTAEQAMAAAPELTFAHPAEGFPLYCDCAAILRESGRQELAHQFIDYLLRPEVSASIATHTRTATTNGAAYDFLPEEIRFSNVLYPGAEVLLRGEWPTALSAKTQRLRDRIWTDIKSA